jgi:hypothetical protein
MRRETAEPMDMTLHGSGSAQPVKKEHLPRALVKKEAGSAIIHKETVPVTPKQRKTIMQEPAEIEFFAREDEPAQAPEQKEEENTPEDIATTERLKAARAGIREQKRKEFEEKVETIASGIQKGAEASAERKKIGSERKKKVQEEQAAWVRALDKQRATARRTVTAAEAHEEEAPPVPLHAPPAPPKAEKKGVLGWLKGLFERKI